MPIKEIQRPKIEREIEIRHVKFIAEAGFSPKNLLLGEREFSMLRELISSKVSAGLIRRDVRYSKLEYRGMLVTKVLENSYIGFF